MIATTLRALALTAAAALCALPARAQTVVGTVADSTSGAAVRGAYVALLDQAGHTVGGTQSDSLGNFALRAPGAGSYRLRVSQLGYWVETSAPIQVGANGTLTVRLLIAPQPIAVEGLSVTSAPHLRRLADGGFYQRQKLGFGSFITRDKIEHAVAIRVTDLFQNLAGVRVVIVDPDTRDTDVIMRGGASMSLAGPCFPTLVVDGAMIRRGGTPEFLGLETVLPSPNEIEAVEIYRSPAGVPGQFAGVSPCGAILMWTRQ